jgi:hypothetical protein
MKRNLIGDQMIRHLTALQCDCTFYIPPVREKKFEPDPLNSIHPPLSGGFDAIEVIRGWTL